MAGDAIPVFIVGGGPVGLALALDLGWRNVPCLLVEQGDGQIVDAKMFATGIRTVEFCRRWGIADQVKNWGFPRDFPFDNVFVTSLTGHEIGRIPMPSIAETMPFDVSPEQFAHCPQFVFDPILARAAASYLSVTLRHNCTLTSFRDEGNEVVAQLHDKISGTEEQVRARYLVACDGFGSAVRKALGIEMKVVAVEEMSIDQCGEQIVSRSDGVKIAMKVEIDFCAGLDLRKAASGSAALHAENRTERRLARSDDHFFAYVSEALRQADGSDGLSFSGGGGRGGSDEDQFASTLESGVAEELKPHFSALGA